MAQEPTHKITQRLIRTGRDICSAIVLLTRLPLPAHWSHQSPQHWPTCTWAYPVVGLVTGTVTAGAIEAFVSCGLSVPIAVLGAIGVGFLLTGALHEDGLADMADGFGGGRDAHHKLEIMKDSQIGVYGLMAVTTATALKCAALIELTPTASHPASTAPPLMILCLLAAIASRAAMSFIIWSLPCARPGGLAHHVTTTATPDTALSEPKQSQSHLPPRTTWPNTTWPNTTWQGGLCLALLLVTLGFWTGPWPLILTVGITCAMTIGMGALMRHHIGGYTGDTLGATQVSVEVALLVTLTTLHTLPA